MDAEFDPQISMNVRTQPCLRARNTARVLTMRVATLVTVIQGTENTTTSVLVGMTGTDK